MLTENLFVYGTLKDPQIQKKVLGRRVEGTMDRLPDYKKSTIRLSGRQFPIVKPAAGQSVEGLVIGVTPPELTQIDHYEGQTYQRQKVTLASGRSAWVYQA
jgi:gamma-glutamylcyclotransferase (GGCT)/AIG2-like uncharacterized protein YtfP